MGGGFGTVRDFRRGVGGPAVARDTTRLVEYSAGLGNVLRGADVARERGVVEGFAEDGVHAVSLALAAVPEHDFFRLRSGCFHRVCFQEIWAVALVVAERGLCSL